MMIDRPRVLVVDDELGPRESLRMILKPAYEIATADSGEAALETRAGCHPDVGFMDIKMPQMDGIELLQRIKRADPSIEVVMITAYASLDTVKNALTHGAFEYLIKPFSRKDLEDTAKRALARRQTELGARTQLDQLVDQMRSLQTKLDDREEQSRREQAEQSLRVTQLSILREISRGILGQLDFEELTAGISKQLRDALGYDEVGVHLGATPPKPVGALDSIVCPIVDNGLTLGYLIAANDAGTRPIDPRERELLEMLSENLAVAIRNSRLYGQVADIKQSLEQLVQSAGDAIISVDYDGQIRGWNPAAENIFGWSPAQALGRPLTMLLPEEPYAEKRAALARGESVRAFPVTINREDGRILKLDVRGGSEGQAEGASGNHPRYDGSEGTGSPDAPVREAHGAGADGGRDRPRLQQPPASHPGIRPAHGQESHQRGRGPPRTRRDREGGDGRRRDRPAHPEVRAPPAGRSLRR